MTLETTRPKHYIAFHRHPRRRSVPPVGNLTKNLLPRGYYVQDRGGDFFLLPSISIPSGIRQRMYASTPLKVMKGGRTKPGGITEGIAVSEIRYFLETHEIWPPRGAQSLTCCSWGPGLSSSGEEPLSPPPRESMGVAEDGALAAETGGIAPPNATSAT